MGPYLAGSGTFGRAAALRRLATEHFDVLVVGGGITGAGVALDAASRGFKTAIVDRGDFASGTSSQSSKLVHGGLRYLQQYDVGLVFQSLAERQTLLRNAPHLVSEQVFIIPLFGKGGVVDKTVARTYAIGLSAYDMFGGFRIGHLHRRITAEEVSSHLPTLRLDRLVAGFCYYDAHADDARLTLEIIRTAALDYGAAAANYAPVVGLLTDPSGTIEGARIAPFEGAGSEIVVHARAVVNATGVWADQLRDLDSKTAHQIRPAKGVHIAVSSAKLPCDAAVVVQSPSDGRNVFIIPWDGSTYVGTTDTDYEGDMDTPGVERGEVDYLLEAANAATTKAVGYDDITGVWSGLRPLLAATPHRHRAPSARTADLSRRHKVLVSPSGLVTITGGKLTTYRKMAEDTVNTVCRELGHHHRRCVTKHLPIRGAKGLNTISGSNTAAVLGVGDDVFAHLVSRYGDQVTKVVALLKENPELAQPLMAGLPYLGAEVVYAARYEMAVTLEDVLARRMRVLPFNAEAAAKLARPVAELAGTELGWDEKRVEDEAAKVSALAASQLEMLRGVQSIR